MGSTTATGVQILYSPPYDKEYLLDIGHAIRYEEYIERWRAGLETGLTKHPTNPLSRHVKRYLREKYGDRCAFCGWSEVNLYTGRVPLEIHHCDGNSENAKEDNLVMICPNCHSLTGSFRNLNRGQSKRKR